MAAVIGNGKAVHLTRSDKTLCGRTGDLTPVRRKATCKACLAKKSAPKKTVKPTAAKARKAAPAKPGPKTKRDRGLVRSAEGVMIQGVRSTVEQHDLPAGVRWVRTNRLGALVASVDLHADTDDDGTEERWGACCLTHGITVRHSTHRNAWKTLARSADWCDSCKGVR